MATFVIFWLPNTGAGVKGNQPAKKVQPKRPAIVRSESEDEREMEDQRIILEQLEALEKAQGLSPGGVVPAGSRVCARVTH